MGEIYYPERHSTLLMILVIWVEQDAHPNDLLTFCNSLIIII